MTTYFDAKSQDDLALLPSGQRKHPDVEHMATVAEADVIRHFTKTMPSRIFTTFDPMSSVTADGAAIYRIGDTERYVFLRGYNADASQADAALATAMKYAIAEVLSWQITHLGVETSVASSADGGGKSRSYRHASKSKFPPSWDRWLQPFDTREYSRPY